MTTTSTRVATPVTDIELVIGGMTCASCANRIERTLNKLDGVSAGVNYATEKARISAPGGVDPAALIAQIEAAGYSAELPQPPAPGRDLSCAADDEDDQPRALRAGASSPAWCWPCRSSRWPWSRHCSSPTGSGSR